MRPFNGRASDGDARPDNQLALLDQAFFDGHRATGQNEVLQGVWIYEHAIDFDGLKRIHHNLGYGLLGRRIERSPLPFGRHRWVSDRGPSDIDIVERARPRGEVSDWADERSQLPLDPERGPGWHLGVLPLTDGSTAVSLVVSHYLIDGVGLFVELFNANLDNTRDLGYPPPRSRTRLRAVVQDARQTARDVPEVVRALVAAAKMARGLRRVSARSPAPAIVTLSGGDDDEVVVVPWVSIYISLDDWDARAQALSGTSNTLAAGLAAKLGEHMGRRCADDGAVTLQLLMTERADGDTRAVAVSFPRVSVDATGATTDLHDARGAIKQALKTQRETPDESSKVASLAPFTPRRTLKRLVGGALTAPDHPVLCSHLGDTPPGARGVDGTDAEYVTARGIGQHLTRQWLERSGGQMILQCARFPGRIALTIQAFQPGAENTKPALRQLAARALAEFGLTGKID